MPSASVLGDSGGLTIVAAEFLQPIDDWRVTAARQLWNRTTHEVRNTERFYWTGEWLVPLETANLARLRILEQKWDEAELQRSLERYREWLTSAGVASHELERRMSEREEFLRSWLPGEES